MFFVRGVILSGVWFARSAEHTESKDPELRTQRDVARRSSATACKCTVEMPRRTNVTICTEGFFDSVCPSASGWTDCAQNDKQTD